MLEWCRNRFSGGRMDVYYMRDVDEHLCRTCFTDNQKHHPPENVCLPGREGLNNLTRRFKFPVANSYPSLSHNDEPCWQSAAVLRSKRTLCTAAAASLTYSGFSVLSMLLRGTSSFVLEIKRAPARDHVQGGYW